MVTTIEKGIDLVENGQIEEGLRILRQNVNKATDEEKFLIAEKFMQWGFVEEALQIANELLSVYPDEGQLYILAAEASIDLENEEKALELLQQVDENDPSYLQALVLMADLYQMQGLDEVAEQKLLTAKKKNPDEILIDFGLGEFYLSKGNYKKSIPYYKNVLKQTDTVGERNINLCLAESLSVSGYFEEALEYFQKGLEQKVELHALNAYAFTAFQLERYELAIAKWKELIELDPEYPTVYGQLARAYEMLEEIDQAFATCEKGIAIDPYQKELYLQAGKLALKLRDVNKALQYLHEAIALDPGYLEALLTLTNALLHEEQYEEVISVIKQSLELGEYDPRFEWDLAKANSALENYSEALNNYENAYNAYKDDINFLTEYGLFLMEEGRRDEALDVFKRALFLDPSLSEIEEHIERLEEW